MRGLLRCPENRDFLFFCQFEFRTTFHCEGGPQLKSFFNATLIQDLEVFVHENWTIAQPRQEVVESFQKQWTQICVDALHAFLSVYHFSEEK